jgi:hypothetical protein
MNTETIIDQNNASNARRMLNNPKFATPIGRADDGSKYYVCDGTVWIDTAWYVARVGDYFEFCRAAKSCQSIQLV